MEVEISVERFVENSYSTGISYKQNWHGFGRVNDDFVYPWLIVAHIVK